MEDIAVALISGAVTLVGVLAANSRSRAVTDAKLDELTRRVGEHNRLVERTYKLERDVALCLRDVEELKRSEDAR